MSGMRRLMALAALMALATLIAWSDARALEPSSSPIPAPGTGIGNPGVREEEKPHKERKLSPGRSRKDVSLITVNSAGGDEDTTAQTLTALLRSGTNAAQDGLTINSISFTGNTVQAGVFTGGKAAGLELDEGLLLSTGYAGDAVNGQNYFNITSDRSSDLGEAGDADLYDLNEQTSGDAAVLTINFTPAGDQVTFRFRFASEEWPANWVFASGYYYYDVFGLFINGENQAIIPTTQTPIGISTIYPAGVSGSPNYPDGSNTDMYVNNTFGGASSTYGNGAVGVAYNGLTTVLTFSATVTANKPNTLKIAIGDAADRNYDSALFIEAHSWRVNRAPKLDNPIADQLADAGKPFRFQIPDDTFSDQDPQDKDNLRYSATRPDGSPLPAWLSFNAATRTFSGVPTRSDLGKTSIKVTATDKGGAGADDTFSLSTLTLASLTTEAPTGVTGSSAVAHAAITATGGIKAVERGFCWSLHMNPDTSDWKTVEKGSFGTGSFSAPIKGFEKYKTFHIRAYAKNSVGTAYGDDVVFTADAPPAIWGTDPNQEVNEDGTIRLFEKTVIEDLDSEQPLEVTVSLDGTAKGSFTPASLDVSGFKAASPGSCRFKGKASLATKAIGQLIFAPAPGRLDPNESEKVIFTVSVNDGISAPVADSNTKLMVYGINHAPSAWDSTVQTNKNQDVKGQMKASDPDKDSLTFKIVQSPAKGSVTINNERTGSFTFNPHKDAFGTDFFTFRASDGKLDSNEATVTVTIAANHPPVAFNRKVIAKLNAPVHIVLNAADVDGDPLTFTVVSPPAYGVLTKTAQGFKYSFTSWRYGGYSDSFTFKANDGMVDSNVATVTITFPNAVAPSARSRGLTAERGKPPAIVHEGRDP